MHCSRCGQDNPPDATRCAHCDADLNAELPVPSGEPAPPSSRPAAQRRFPRPPGYPSVLMWFVTGAFRNWRGLLGAVVAAWLNLPLAILLGGCGLVVGGIAGLLGANALVLKYLPHIPVLTDLLSSTVLDWGGVIGLLLGMVLGALGGFVGGLAMPWLLVFDGDLWRAVGLALAQLLTALLVGALYTVYAVAVEGTRFRISGYRQPSRRESALITPVLRDCAARLGLAEYPKLLVDDSREPNAYAGARHIVVTRGFLDEFNYETGPLAGVLCHELTHWRNADAVSSYFIRGVALPLYLVYAFLARLVTMFGGWLRFVAWLVAWPVLIAIRYFVMPMQAAGGRSAEYQADQGSVVAGHRAGLRRVLARFRESFDGARDGWERSVLATHPPNELRLDRLEEPGVGYRLPDSGTAGEYRECASCHAAADTTAQYCASCGSRLDPATPAQPSEVTGTPPFAVPNVRLARTVGLIAGALIVLLVVSGVGLSAIQRTVYSGPNAIRGYFGALADRDATTALSYLDMGHPGRPSRLDGPRPATGLLTDNALRSNGYRPPTDVRITRYRQLAGSGQHARATVSYLVGSHRYQTGVTLRRQRTATDGFFYRWVLTGGLPTVLADPASGVPLQLGGATVPTGKPALLVFPGAYRLAVARNPLVSGQPVTFTVGTGGEQLASPSLSVKGSARSAVDSRVHDYLDTCAATPDPSPSGCPLDSSYTTSDVSDPHWTVDEYPTIEVRVSSDGSTVLVDTVRAGRATLHGRDAYFGEKVNEHVAVNVSGTAGVSGGRIEFTPSYAED